MTPLIMITNDDGIESDGIKALADAMVGLGDVVVAAPARQQSAVSHSISLSHPLRVKPLGESRYAISGTPADACFLGLFELCPRVPDIVVSGINHGANVGTDLYYSGTMAGAMEAAIRGIPAIAVSQQLPESLLVPPSEQAVAEKADHWDPFERTDDTMKRCLKATAEFAARVTKALLTEPVPGGAALSLNGPNQPAQGYRWTTVGGRLYRGHTDRRVDPRGVAYYWIGGPRERYEPEPGTDLEAIENGFFSLSPVRIDRNANIAEPPALTTALAAAE
jgi:5'-nucleotidase